MFLMSFQVLNNTFLLSKFCIKEFRIGFEFVCQPLLRLVEELGLIANSLEECIVNLYLDIALMVLLLLLSVIIESGLHIRADLFFLLVEVHDDVIILLLLFRVGSFNVLHLLTKLPQLLDLWGEGLFSVFDFLFNLLDSLGDFLESLIFLVIEKLLLIGDSLNLLLNVRVSSDTLGSLEVLHEFSQVLSSAFKDLSGPLKDSNL